MAKAALNSLSRSGGISMQLFTMRCFLINAATVSTTDNLPFDNFVIKTSGGNTVMLNSFSVNNDSFKYLSSIKYSLNCFKSILKIRQRDGRNVCGRTLLSACSP